MHERLLLSPPPQSTLAEVKKKLCDELEADEEQYELVDYLQLEERQALGDLELSVTDAGLVNNQDVLLRPKNQKVVSLTLFTASNSDAQGDCAAAWIWDGTVPLQTRFFLTS